MSDQNVKKDAKKPRLALVPQTRAEKFLELFPKCEKVEDEDGAQSRPAFCWEMLVGGSQGCSCHDLDCYDCWNKPYEGEFEEVEHE